MRTNAISMRLPVKAKRGTCGPAANLLIDCEENRTLRAVLVGMLREATTRPGAARSPYGEQHGTRLEFVTANTAMTAIGR